MFYSINTFTLPIIVDLIRKYYCPDAKAYYILENYCSNKDHFYCTEYFLLKIQCLSKNMSSIFTDLT